MRSGWWILRGERRRRKRSSERQKGGVVNLDCGKKEITFREQIGHIDIIQTKQHLA